MMFRAIGVGVQKDPATNLISVKVRIEDDRVNPPKAVKEQSFKGADVDAIKAQIATELTAMKRNEDDVSVVGQVIGKVLGTI